MLLAACLLPAAQRREALYPAFPLPSIAHAGPHCGPPHRPALSAKFAQKSENFMFDAWFCILSPAWVAAIGKARAEAYPVGV
jgi:hypothetical protein